MTNKIAEQRFGYLVPKPDAAANAMKMDDISKYGSVRTPRDSANLVEIPRATKELACGKCGRTMTVSERTVLAYCPACSQGLGVKR
jgi:uncharacterized CHY-type Zn-finger protein